MNDENNVPTNSETDELPEITREQFLAINDCAPRKFVSPAWGCTMRYRPATIEEKAIARRLGKDHEGKLDGDAFGSHLIVMCLVSPKLQIQDVGDLKKKNACEVDRLYNAIVGSVNPNPK